MRVALLVYIGLGGTVGKALGVEIPFSVFASRSGPKLWMAAVENVKIEDCLVLVGGVERNADPSHVDVPDPPMMATSAAATPPGCEEVLPSVVILVGTVLRPRLVSGGRLSPRTDVVTAEGVVEVEDTKELLLAFPCAPIAVLPLFTTHDERIVVLVY
jgi:hypothetical protein